MSDDGPTLQIALRVPPALTRRIDRCLRQMRRAYPDMPVTRSHVMRQALGAGIDELLRRMAGAAAHPKEEA